MKLFSLLFSLSIILFAHSQKDTIPKIEIVESPEFHLLGGRFGFGIVPEPEIRYFPFYNNIQIIEIDYYNHSLAVGSHEDMIHPRGGSSYWDAISFNTPNGYILRDRSGKILSSYNVSTPDKIKLQTPEEAPITYHKQNLDSPKESMRSRGAGEKYSWANENGYAYHIMGENHLIGMMDTLGIIRLPIKFETISYVDTSYIVQINGVFGLYNSNFELKVPAIYKRMEFIKSGTYLACDGKCHFIDQEGKLLDTTAYDQIKINNRANTFMTYMQNGKYGLIDTNLKHITEAKYKWVESLDSKGYYATDSTNKIAIINEQGVQITSFKYEQGKPVYRNDGFYFVKSIDKEYKEKGYRYPVLYGLVDTNGHEPVAFKYESIDPFVNGVAKAKFKGFFGLINDQGKELTEFIYTNIHSTGSGSFNVRIGSSYGLLDKNGKVLIPVIYSQIDCVSEGMAIVRCDNKKIGFVAFEGGKDIPCIYDNAWCFKNGFARITLDGKTGCINKDGLEISAYKFDYVFEFKSEIALVKKGDKYGAIDKTGKEVVPTIYTSFKYLDNGAIEFKKSDKRIVYPG